jgi:hypothetical protein
MSKAPLAILFALGVGGIAQAATLTGTIFEDANYGGGPGRSLSASGGVGLANVRVELYRLSDGAALDGDLTDANGVFVLSSGNNHVPVRVRVVNGSVLSARAGGAGCSTCVPVQTFRTEGSTGNTVVAVTDRVGGENTQMSDAVTNGTGNSNPPANYSTLTAGTRVPQSVTVVDPTANNSTVSGIDFGFNFSTIVSSRDTTTACGATTSSFPCQGTLRQFIINSNALGGEGALEQAGVGQIDGSDAALPSGFESSIFMIPAAQLSGGVAVITLAGALPAVAGPNTRLDATTQTVNVGNTHGGTLGTGGTVGVDGIALSLFQRPEVQISAGDTSVVLSGNGGAILGFAMHRGYLQLTGVGCLARHNLVGMTAGGSSADNTGAAYGITFTGANSTIRHNFVTVNNSGIRTDGGGAGSLVTLNEVARPTSGHTNTFDGILLVGTVSNIQVTANLARDQRGGGIEVGFGGGAGATSILVTNNTVRNNGFNGVGGGAASTEPIGMAAYDYAGSGVAFSRNVVRDNAGPGIMLMRVTGTQVSQNSFSSNGGLSIDLDPRSIDPNTLGTPHGVSLNDLNDADTGPPNGLLNYPVFTTSVLLNGELQVSGFARPNSAIELYVAQADPSGFGEGFTYLGTLIEGSVADLDATTGSYGPGAINGVAQGTDNTQRFLFRMPVPSGVALGTALTATATLTGQTSEFSGNVIVTGGPTLQVRKQVQLISDPLNGSTLPRSIPGSLQLYAVTLTNQGPGPVDGDSVAIIDKVPADTRLFVGDLGAPGSGPVSFVDGAPASGLTWTFTALDNAADDLDFSNDGGVTWTYVPVPDADGYDAAVTDIRMRPKGTMPGQGVGSPNCELRFRVSVN